MTTPQKFVDEVESLSAILHEIYMKEAERQGDVRHDWDYSKLKESTKEYDRVLARYILAREALALSKAEARGRLAGLGEQYKDDKKLDGTDYAHPAWWRGHDSGCDGIVLALNDVLDGKKKGGIFGSPSLQKLRERIENIEAEGARLENEAIINIIHEKFYSGMCEGDLLQHIRSRQRSSK